jgi:hypothetical protein
VGLVVGGSERPWGVVEGCPILALGQRASDHSIDVPRSEAHGDRVEVSHQGDGCTFETLCAMFGLQDRALARIATIVHDLDLKDGRFGAPEAPTLGAIIEGLQLAQPDDHALLAEGMTLFESLYRAFERSARSAGPRPLARSRKTGTARRRRRSSERQ